LIKRWGRLLIYWAVFSLTIQRKGRAIVDITLWLSFGVQVDISKTVEGNRLQLDTQRLVLCEYLTYWAQIPLVVKVTYSP
jgi:hypothetical protein